MQNKHSKFNNDIDQLSKGREFMYLRIHTLKSIFCTIIDEAIADGRCDIVENGMNVIVDQMKKFNMTNGNVLCERDKGKQVIFSTEKEIRNQLQVIRVPSVWSTKVAEAPKGCSQ